MSYPSEKADSLEWYVFHNFELSRPSLHLYRGMRWLEREGAGLCRKVRAGYRSLSEAAGINIKTMKAALSALHENGLIELDIGSPIKSNKKETEFRRKTLDEIKAQSIQGDSDADKLARVLSEKPLRFNGETVKPMWTVAKTGRVISSKPNIQGMKSHDRLSGLIEGLRPGQVVVHADIKAAEPTIIKHLVGIPLERDLYREYMAATGCARSEAKKAVNMLAYCRDSLACFGHWPEPAQAALGDYVRKLSDYRGQLFPESRKARSVTTMTGRAINAGKGKRIHAGQVMNWRVQGTVADIVNVACLRLMDAVSVVIPLHDAVYAVLPADRVGEVERCILDRARAIGLSVKVESEVHHAC